MKINPETWSIVGGVLAIANIIIGVFVARLIKQLDSNSITIIALEKKVIMLEADQKLHISKMDNNLELIKNQIQYNTNIMELNFKNIQEKIGVGKAGNPDKT